MFKNINKIFVATALVAFVLTSCTDEEEIIKGSTKTNSKNNKVLVTEKQPYEICQYPEYDDNDYDETTMMHYIEDFDRLMRTGESEVQTYDLTKSVAVLELYYNYAVVDKQTSYDESIEYDPQIFEFTVPLYEGQVNVTELKNAYHEFLNEVLETMGNKYLMYSNIYVETKTSNSVTFGLKATGFKPNYIGRVRLLADPDEVSIPSAVQTNWNGKPHMYVDYLIRAYALKYNQEARLAGDFTILNQNQGLYAVDNKVSLGIYNTTANTPDLVFKGSDRLPSMVNWVITRCNTLHNYPFYQSYSTYDICGVAPAKYVSSDQEIFLSISSIDLCKMKNWTLLQALLNSIIFQAN